MINFRQAKKYCKEDISKIENYAAALADNSQTWDLHHKTEIWWNCSKKDLIENECYYNRKACELVFLTRSEHDKLHHKDKVVSESTRQKLSASLKGKIRKPLAEDTRRKISEAMKGENNPFYGKSHTEDTRRKLSEARKGKTWKVIDGKRVWYSKEVE